MFFAAKEKVHFRRLMSSTRSQIITLLGAKEYKLSFIQNPIVNYPIVNYQHRTKKELWKFQTHLGIFFINKIDL